MIRKSKKRLQEIYNLVGKDIDASDDKGYTALIHASHYGWPDIVEVLIKAGANLNKLDNNGCTALIWATREGNISVVKDLIKAGADLDMKDHKGDTAFDHAHNVELRETITNAIAERDRPEISALENAILEKAKTLSTAFTFRQ